MMEVIESPAVIHLACNVLIFSLFCSPTLLLTLLIILHPTIYISLPSSLFLTFLTKLQTHTPTRTHT